MSSDHDLLLKIDRIHLPIYHVYAYIRALAFMFGESHLLVLYTILLNGYLYSVSFEQKKTLDEI